MARVIEVYVPKRARILKANLAPMVRDTPGVHDVKITRSKLVDRVDVEIDDAFGIEGEGRVRAAVAAAIDGEPELRKLTRLVEQLAARVDQLEQQLVDVAGAPALRSVGRR